MKSKCTFSLTIFFTIWLLMGCGAPGAEPGANEQGKSIETAVIPTESWGESWLLTANDMNKLFADNGIIDWTVDDEMVGENRMFRIFSGVSWSVNPNFAANGIYRTEPGNTLADLDEDLHTEGIILPDAALLKSSSAYAGEAALYGAMLDNGHIAFDMLLLQEEHLFWVGFSVGTPLGYTVETMFAENGEDFESLLNEMLQLNLERRSPVN